VQLCLAELVLCIDILGGIRLFEKSEQDIRVLKEGTSNFVKGTLACVFAWQFG
jgi:hypothetical protein